jgi:WD40 repeat protein
MSNKCEKIRDLLLCQICNLTYEHPIRLPCGKTICKSHILDSSGCFLKDYECSFCHLTHEIPTKGYHPNFFLQKLITQRQHLNLKTKLENALDDLKVSHDEIDEAKEYVHEHFLEIHAQILQYRDYLYGQLENVIEKMFETTRNQEEKVKSQLENLKIFKDETFNQLKQDLDMAFRRAKIEIDQLETQLFNMNRMACDLNKQLTHLIQTDLKSFTFFGELKPLVNECFEHVISANNFEQSLSIISCYKDGSLVMRDLRDEFQLDFFNGKHENDVNCILISSDKQKLISGDKRGHIKVWDIGTGELLKSISNLVSGKKRSVKCLINSPHSSNEVLFGSSLNEIRSLDLNTYTITCIFSNDEHSKQVLCLEFLTNEILLSSSDDFKVKLWNFPTKTLMQDIELNQSAQRLRRIDDSSFSCGFNDGNIKIFGSVKESLFECFTTLNGRSGFIKELKVCSSLNMLISASVVIHLWSLDDFTCLKQLRPNNNSLTCTIEVVSNNRLIVANENNTLEIWCLETGNSLKILKDRSSLINKIQYYK